MNLFVADNMLTEKAYAKINLALHVRKRRDDGYHELDTIFAFVDRGDEVTAELSETLELRITGPFAAGLDSGAGNLVMRTALLMQKHYNVRDGARLTLEKNLPIASGIGGGSADAAAAARLLNKLWNINAQSSELEHITAVLGADIPACIVSFTARGIGTGTTLEPVEMGPHSAIPILLINPQQPVSTRAVFAAWQGLDRGPITGDDLWDMIKNGRNDLEEPAISICPAISEVLAIVEAQHPLLSRMSGSGATCFALFESLEELDQASAAIKAAHPQYWTMAGRLR